MERKETDLLEEEEKIEGETREMLGEYILYNNPSHGWLEVPLKELEDLGIIEDITLYSYIKGPKAYLEEDTDASLFMNEYKKQIGEEPEIKSKEVNSLDKNQKYKRYNPEGVKMRLSPVADFEPSAKGKSLGETREMLGEYILYTGPDDMCWLEVPLKELEDLGIIEDISSYRSFMKGPKGYLHYFSDGIEFMKEYEEQIGEEPEISFEDKAFLYGIWRYRRYNPERVKRRLNPNSDLEILLVEKEKKIEHLEEKIEYLESQVNELRGGIKEEGVVNGRD